MVARGISDAVTGRGCGCCQDKHTRPLCLTLTSAERAVPEFEPRQPFQFSPIQLDGEGRRPRGRRP